jgi:hypothetical protein
VRGLNQRPSRKRKARSLPARRGSATITAAAAIPAPATTASAARAPIPAPREDALRTFSADELIVVTLPDEDATWLEKGSAETALKRFSLPVTHLVVRD